MYGYSVLTLEPAAKKESAAGDVHRALRSAAVPANHKRRLQTGFDKALEEARADIDRIVNNPDEPTFANTVAALAFSGERLDNVSSVFFNLNEANTNDTMQNLALEISPVLTEFSNDITLNPALRTGQSGLRPTRLARPDARTVSPARKDLQGFRAQRRGAVETDKKDLPRVNRQTVATDPEIQPEHARRDQRLYPAHHRLGAGRRTARLLSAKERRPRPKSVTSKGGSSRCNTRACRRL